MIKMWYIAFFFYLTIILQYCCASLDQLLNFFIFFFEQLTYPMVGWNYQDNMMDKNIVFSIIYKIINFKF
jgi:hypothetical protein